jgi:hypothetical protein
MTNSKLEYTPLKHFTKRLAEIAHLQNIPADLAKANARKHSIKTELVYAGYAVMLVALWQSFWERLADEAFESKVRLHPDPAFQETLRAPFRETLKRFNTPNAENIDRLVKVSTGIPRISSTWILPDLSNEQIRQRLSEILQTRHEIAHTEIRALRLGYEANLANMELLHSLACMSSDVVATYLGSEK